LLRISLFFTYEKIFLKKEKKYLTFMKKSIKFYKFFRKI
jgi:hypothetical protein